MIKAVLCDLGDTLINFHRIDVITSFVQGARETYVFLGDNLGLKLPPFKKYRRQQQWAIRWAYLKSKITGREFNSLNVLRKSTEKLHIPVPEDQFEELAWRWYKPLALQAKADSHTIPMLEELQRRNLKLAIVSNTFVPPSALDRHLAQEDLLKYFPLRVYSCDVGVRKPKPHIFRVALQKLGVEPEEAVFVGDSYRADILGARRSRMFAILKTTKVKPHMDPSIILTDSLRQVPGIIDQINETFFQKEP
ncbi:MAG: HAD family hydrolase [Phycisphaerae bacterium]